MIVAAQVREAMRSQDEHFVDETVSMLLTLPSRLIQVDEDVTEVRDSRDVHVVRFVGGVRQHVGGSVHAAVPLVVFRNVGVVHQHDRDVPVPFPRMVEKVLKRGFEPVKRWEVRRRAEDLHHAAVL